MQYYVYMLKCITSAKKRTYVGFTNDPKNRLKNHNSNKGAKYTKGNKWRMIYKKKFLSKSKAMSYEYILKHDRKKRLKIYNSYK
ncbi:GIY-YIG nuclease family protein [Pelagibacterales bacterium SAG-MED47]|nr:GIY-YIG nuclease family protein [Pelagibacterales bacterium SAG-MED47]